MVQELEASEDLRAALPYGAQRQMAETFGCSERWIGRVISGKNNGDKRIVECANKIAFVHFDASEEIKEILNEYEAVN